MNCQSLETLRTAYKRFLFATHPDRLSHSLRLGIFSQDSPSTGKTVSSKTVMQWKQENTLFLPQCSTLLSLATRGAPSRYEQEYLAFFGGYPPSENSYVARIKREASHWQQGENCVVAVDEKGLVWPLKWYCKWPDQVRFTVREQSADQAMAKATQIALSLALLRLFISIPTMKPDDSLKDLENEWDASLESMQTDRNDLRSLDENKKRRGLAMLETHLTQNHLAKQFTLKLERQTGKTFADFLASSAMNGIQVKISPLQRDPAIIKKQVYDALFHFWRWRDALEHDSWCDDFQVCLVGSDSDIAAYSESIKDFIILPYDFSPIGIF